MLRGDEAGFGELAHGLSGGVPRYLVRGGDLPLGWELVAGLELS
jgi:hypothetical protein